MTPSRIRLSRAKGWRLPENAVSVARPGKFGNPFKVDECRAAGFSGTDWQVAYRCVDAFRVWLGPRWRINWDGEESEAARTKLLDALPTLRGKNLACWCAPDQPCHADVLLEMANK